jgi:hypothetical protein
MDVILHFLEASETWIYLVFGLFGLIFLRRVILDWREWRSVFFGIEKEIAQRKFSADLTIFLLAVFLGLAEFLLVSFVSPNLPRTNLLATPTINFLATSRPTAAGTQIVTTPTGSLPTLVVVAEGGCAPGKVEWLFPKSGGELKGEVKLRGTVNIPNLGFYKYEYSSAGSNNWVTISAGNTIKVEADLGGLWNTANLVPGDYRLRLVVADSQNAALPACVINIRVVAP